MTDTTQDDGLIERLRATDKFVNDPVSLKPRRRNPDGPEAADRIAALRAENEALRACLTECADDLESEVRDRWGYDERLSHKLERDLVPVVAARALLGSKT